MLGIKCENFVYFLSIVPFSQENSKALNTMPFISDDNDNERSIKHRIWLAENQKRLVLKENRSVSLAEDGEEEGASKSQLFIFVLTNLVTYLNMKFDSQLRSSRTHHNHSTRF